MKEDKEFFNNKINELYNNIEYKDRLCNDLQDTIIKKNDTIFKAERKVQRIIDYGFDYDGCNTINSLKDLIDDLVRYARQAKDLLLSEKCKPLLGESIIYDTEDKRVLAEDHWKEYSYDTLKNKKKDELIDMIRILESRYAGEIKSNILYRQRLINVANYFNNVDLFNKVVSLDCEKR